MIVCSAYAPKTVLIANQPTPARNFQRGRKCVAVTAESQSRCNHLRHAIPRTERGEHAEQRKAEDVTDDQTQCGARQTGAVQRDCEYAYRPRRDLRISGKPQAEELPRRAVALLRRDEFDPSRFDLENLVAVNRCVIVHERAAACRSAVEAKRTPCDCISASAASSSPG